MQIESGYIPARSWSMISKAYLKIVKVYVVLSIRG